MRRCDELGAISEEDGRLTRTFHSPAMARANALVGSWMREAGLDVREDAAFNLIGCWPASARAGRGHSREGAARRRGVVLLGSHLDTVRDAGKYDGPLGVLVALAAVQHLRASGLVLPFDVEIAGFSDEEGVRYQTTYLGSRAMAGTLTRRDLARIEEKAIVRARRRRGEIVTYVEAHIEQGPVLEQHDVPLGVVTAIAGQSRIRVELHGRAGHAGTTPMEGRRDALCGAAELVLAAERCGVVATVGQIGVEPGASNVIPGRATLTLDVRHADDRRRLAAVRRLQVEARAIARRRGLRLVWTPVQETPAVRCDPTLTRLLASSVQRVLNGGSRRSGDADADAIEALRTRDPGGTRRAAASREAAHVAALRQTASAHEALRRVASRRAESDVLHLPSGAGHDAAALAAICPVAMLFVRCRGGVSHHPAESVRRADVACAIAAMADLLVRLGARHA